MKNALILFTVLFITGYVFTISYANTKPPLDEIDALLNQVSKNIETSGEVTKLAQSMNAEMVESKVAEKAELKKEVAASKEQIGKLVKTMLYFDVDTAYVNMEIDTAQLNNMKRLNQIK
jgi:50S ribosomal subunit-associated GTPase HflX